MGVGANPTAWFVVLASLLTLARVWLETRKEARMKTTKSRRKAQVKSSFKYLKLISAAFVETTWAIMTSFAAGFVTHSIYAKGAPRKS